MQSDKTRKIKHGWINGPKLCYMSDSNRLVFPTQGERFICDQSTQNIFFFHTMSS